MKQSQGVHFFYREVKALFMIAEIVSPSERRQRQRERVSLYDFFYLYHHHLYSLRMLNSGVCVIFYLFDFFYSRYPPSLHAPEGC